MQECLIVSKITIIIHKIVENKHFQKEIFKHNVLRKVCVCVRERGKENVINLLVFSPKGLPRLKNLPAMQETWVQSLGWEDPLEKGKATPVFWPGEFHGLYSPWARKESDTTE